MEENYKFSDEATLELHRAQCYFKLLGREDEFLDDLLKQLRLILKMPNAFQVKYGSIRIVLFENFNYSIHYRVKEDGHITIYRILNQNQHF